MLPKNHFRHWEILLAALYLPGSPHGQYLDRRRWPAILGAFRSLSVSLQDAGTGLRSKGLIAEAVTLETSGTIEWAAKMVNLGRVSTLLGSNYPERWLAVLKDQVPPVAWKSGAEADAGPSLSIVGSRHIEPYVHHFCAEVARNVVDLGFRVVSGGAVGCDQTALDAATRHGGYTLVLAPFGLEHIAERTINRESFLSFCEPSEVFSRGRAMERNTMIYAASRITVVGQVRFREGGTWHGATSAIRRNLTTVLVRRPGPHEDESVVRGAKALVSLGGSFLDDPGQLEDFVLASPLDHGLFASLRAG